MLGSRFGKVVALVGSCDTYHVVRGEGWRGMGECGWGGRVSELVSSGEYDIKYWEGGGLIGALAVSSMVIGRPLAE